MINSLSLTKSQLKSALQCHKRLWLEIHQPTETSPINAYRMSQGREVGKLARQQFSEGVLIETKGKQALETTQALINSGETCLFEAAFEFDYLYIRCDILQKDKNSDDWSLIEVKSSGEVKPEYIEDVAIQKYVLMGLGFQVSQVKLMIVNKQSCYFPDLANFFIVEDVLSQVDHYLQQNLIRNLLTDIKPILSFPDSPKIEVGKHCTQPYPCPFKEDCWQNIPQASVFTIPRLDKKKLAQLQQKNIINLEDIPEDFPLTDKQRSYIKTILENRETIDLRGIQNELKLLKYPLHFLDFETFNPAIPRFEKMKPFESFPFQYSCHVLDKNGTLTHQDYLHSEINDPRLLLIRSLVKDINSQGSIIVYNLSFEKKILEELTQAFPDYQVLLQSMINRLWDLQVIFKKYYHYVGFNGSTSLKTILPVLCPDLSYNDLAIQKGEQAVITWNQMINCADLLEKQTLMQNLKDYCKLDTLAMVKIYETLLEKLNLDF